MSTYQMSHALDVLGDLRHYPSLLLSSPVAVNVPKVRTVTWDFGVQTLSYT